MLIVIIYFSFLIVSFAKFCAMSIYAFIIGKLKAFLFEKTNSIIWFSLFWTTLVAIERAR